LEAKRPMLINQDDPESTMSRKEAGLILDEKVNSALLVPLILNDKPVGVISLGEMRNWDRQPLTEEEITFVKHKANQICVALEKGLLFRVNKQLKERLKGTEKSEEVAYDQIQVGFGLSDLSYQITDPLTSIRGSAELLKLKEPHLNADSSRYIKNIENGVDRIHRSLEVFLNSAAERKRSQLKHLKEELTSV
jgi:K+-sensing histidine kinase KdpD